MARRKRMLDDGDDSDSSVNSEGLDVDIDNDPDAREERALFENPYKYKRRRKNGKEDALYGIFADDSEDDVGGRNVKSSSRKSDWTKAPAFVTSDKPVNLDQPMVVDSDDEGDVSNGGADVDGGDNNSDGSEDDGSEGEDEVGEEVEYSNESESSRPPSPRVRIEEGDEAEPPPRIGGIGSSINAGMSAFLKGGIGSSRGAVPSFEGPRRGGIGSKPPSSYTTPPDADSGNTTPTVPSAPDPTPSAFATRSRSFMAAASPSPRPVALPASEMAHFGKIQNTFGARMLAKMGWEAGTGLGAAGEGIVIPIESKLRPQKMGIAFKGFKEKTAQSKLEAKRRGETISDEEDEKTKKFRKKAKEQEQKRSDVWKRPKKVKTKIEHKSYEQIIAESGESAAPGIGKIIDATGAVPREVSSLADISLNSWSPSNDPTRIPEVRHNLRLIADVCKTDLDGLAREARALQERKKYVNQEDSRLRKRVENEADLIARLQQVQLVTNDINTTARELTSVYEVSLEPFSPSFHKLITEYSTEYDRYHLDEVVVGAIAPIVRRMATTWNPLEDPMFFLSTFRSWRRALKVNEEKPPQMEVSTYGSGVVATQSVMPEKPMTSFESLLWNIWLPKVRAAINNDWLPEDPQPAVKLYEAWSSFLPPFIRDNLLDQLILPKVQKAVADWNTKTAKVSLQAIVFPWLPYVGLRLEEVVGDARRKIKNLLRSWVVDSPIPGDLIAWKDVFDSGDWDAILLKMVVPKLGAMLRNDFRVNPRDQKMESLERVLQWSNMIRPSILSQILETEFFPKWLDVLHIWLIQPKVSFEEVAQWYTFWKDTFPEHVRNISGINRGFTRGLQLMNKAIELGPKAPTELPRPNFLQEISAPSTPARGTRDSKTTRPSARTHEITFRAIAEEYAASRNLLFVPIGQAHERSRMPLYRVSQTADGKKGLLVYILDDAIWAPKEGAVGAESEDFQAVSLDTMVLRATSS